MLLQIIHETSYRYRPAVTVAQHLAHLSPRSGPGQHVITHELVIEPWPQDRHDSQDRWGNTCTRFSFQVPHEGLRATARSLVSTWPVPPAASRISWEDARERSRPAGAAADFLDPSPYVNLHPEFAAYAQPSFTPGRPLADAARDLMVRIHREFEYHTEATDASTPALDALRLRRGVCQDFTHVMLGCLRSLGLPARYVSGYLLTQAPPGRTRLVGSDASHAWVSVHLPGPGGGEWLDLDPTNEHLPGEDYVVLATGRDYSDISPLGGVISGGVEQELQVSVTVEALPG